MKLEKITFCPDGDEAVEFYVLDSQRLAGVNYLLVTDSEVGDGEALILKDVSADADLEAVYEIVEDDETLEALVPLFEDSLEDIELE